VRPLLILDLDETLVWATEDKQDGICDFRAFRYYVTKRPHLDRFLETVSLWFKLAVWTSSGEDYAAIVVGEIFNDVTLEFVWASSRCTQRYDGETRQYYSLKNLKKVQRKGFPLGRVLAIDDSPEKLC
jgi:RNA polymerase II subunit A small phosphatase-like protein